MAAKLFELNPKVEVCFMDSRKYHARIEGLVNISKGKVEKKRLLELNPKVRNHFKDENDPNFVLIEIIPNRIRWTEPGFGEYHIEHLTI